MHVLRLEAPPPSGERAATQGGNPKSALRDEDLIRLTTNRALHLILLPTEACNFRCVYCYEEFRYRSMEDWVVRGVKALVERRAERLYDLWLSWFGGEPLLAMRIIEDVMTHATRLDSAHADLTVRSDMTTNGYLLSERTFLRLHDLKVRRFQISFDGPAEWHDRKRVLAGGKGTFQRIWDNLLGIRGLPGDFQIMIRIHVAEDNVDVMPEFVTRCAETFGSDPRFELFIRGLSRYGGANDATLPILDPGKRDEILGRLRSLAQERGARVVGPPAAGYICYAAHGNSYVVRANGRLNKCTVALEHPSNQVGRIREDGTVDVDSTRLSGWMRGVLSGDPRELACPMKGHALPGVVT